MPLVKWHYWSKVPCGSWMICWWLSKLRERERERASEREHQSGHFSILWDIDKMIEMNGLIKLDLHVSEYKLVSMSKTVCRQAHHHLSSRTKKCKPLHFRETVYNPNFIVGTVRLKMKISQGGAPTTYLQLSKAGDLRQDTLFYNTFNSLFLLCLPFLPPITC